MIEGLPLTSEGQPFHCLYRGSTLKPRQRGFTRGGYPQRQTSRSTQPTTAMLG